MEKVIVDSAGKVWESRSSVSYIFREKQKSIQFSKLKTWEKWISIVWERYGKIQTFQIYGSLEYFEWSRNPYNSQNMGKVDFHSTGKVWEIINITKLCFSKLCFSDILGEAEIDTVPKTWEKWISIVREKYGKTQTFQIYGFLKYFGLSRNP